MRSKSSAPLPQCLSTRVSSNSGVLTSTQIINRFPVSNTQGRARMGFSCCGVFANTRNSPGIPTLVMNPTARLLTGERSGRGKKEKERERVVKRGVKSEDRKKKEMDEVLRGSEGRKGKKQLFFGGGDRWSEEARVLLPFKQRKCMKLQKKEEFAVNCSFLHDSILLQFLIRDYFIFVMLGGGMVVSSTRTAPPTPPP